MRISVEDIRKAYNPEEKADDDALMMVRYIVRPLSFYLAWVFAVFGISANSVTWISLIVSLLGAIGLAMSDVTWKLMGCAMFFLWILLDHVDGNLARYYKSPSIVGDFLDTFVCYVTLVIFPLGLAIGISNPIENLIEIKLIILLGGSAGILGILPRLLYQKVANYGIKIQLQNKKQTVGELSLLKYSITFLKTFANSILNPSGFLFPILFIFIYFNISILYLCIYNLLLLIVNFLVIQKCLWSLHEFDIKQNLLKNTIKPDDQSK